MTRRPKRQRHTALFALAGVLTAALWLFASPPAAACSCEEMSHSAIERADAAVVGTIVETMSIPSQYEDQERFVAQVTVTSDLKDNLDDTIYLTSEKDDGGNCGVSWRTATEIAAAIYELDGVLYSDGCSEMSPTLADSWKPAKTIGGLATLLIGGDAPNRLVAYDETGTPIAFAFEPGQVHSVSVCPDTQVAVEIVNNYTTGITTVDTRSLSTFEVTSSIDAIFDGEPLTLDEIQCDSPDGSEASTTGFVLSDGVFRPSDQPVAPTTFDPEDFWPQLRTGTTAPVTGESWMWRAIELEPPVAVDATGRSAPVAQIGAGESFGLGQGATIQDDAAQPNDDDQGVPLIREDAQTQDGNNIVFWVVGILAVALAVGAVYARGRRS